MFFPFLAFLAFLAFSTFAHSQVFNYAQINTWQAPGCTGVPDIIQYYSLNTCWEAQETASSTKYYVMSMLTTTIDTSPNMTLTTKYYQDSACTKLSSNQPTVTKPKVTTYCETGGVANGTLGIYSLGFPLQQVNLPLFPNEAWGVFAVYAQPHESNCVDENSIKANKWSTPSYVMMARHNQCITTGESTSMIVICTDPANNNARLSTNLYGASKRCTGSYSSPASNTYADCRSTDRVQALPPFYLNGYTTITCAHD